MILVHVAKKEDYENALKSSFYGSFSIKKDGFIHCSKIEDVIDVANDNLKSIKDDLLILCIDARKVKSEIKWEERGSKKIKFPHIYGLLNMDAVINVIPFLKNKNGDFYLPTKVLEYKKES